ncbi:MAG: FAD-dependent oxidoreductase, partial [Victivallales bacterium]|nr:FAD-dependent oxidoreductase [Victivallales bacterium]
MRSASFAIALLVPSLLLAAPKRVLESARQIPLAADVDVVVVGGGSGGIAAAAAAAEAGARVFVVAPRMYLGEDLCAPYRLWLAPGQEPDTPLAKAMFADPVAARGLPFTYTASLPSVGKHVDTTPPRMLNDGQWMTAFTQSVQYDGDVTITLDLGETHSLSRIAAKIFQSPKRFDIRNLAVSVSLDGKAWKKAGDLANPDHLKGDYVERPLGLTMPASGKARYVKFDVSKGKVASRVLLGELQVFSLQDDKAKSKLAQNTTPMLVKSALEEALIEAGVQFVYGSPATDVLRDANGRLAGVVIANRAGRQAIRAKAVIDATGHGWFAKLAGADVTSPEPGTQRFRRIVVGGKPRKGKGIVSCKRIPIRVPVGGVGPAAYGSGGFGGTVQRINGPMQIAHPELFEYTLSLPVADASFAALAEAEQLARDVTFDPNQVEESETLLPTSGVVVDAAGVAGFYVAPTGINPSPLAVLRAGTELGTTVAKAVKAMASPKGVRVAGLPATSATETKGVLGENLQGFRPMAKAETTIPSPARALPVVGEYDVVVVGGG